MGIFSRSSQADGENDAFDDSDLPTSTDINDDPFTSDEAALDFTLDKQASSPSAKMAYGIEQAIRLMKALPRDNNEVVVTVVKKTLESTNIEVQDIIDDANTREERMRAKQKQLETEIKNLQSEITQRNQRISELVQDLKETGDVRQRLQLAMELDTRKSKTAETAKPSQTKPAEAPSAGTPAGPNTSAATTTSSAVSGAASSSVSSNVSSNEKSSGSSAANSRPETQQNRGPR